MKLWSGILLLFLVGACAPFEQPRSEQPPRPVQPIKRTVVTVDRVVATKAKLRAHLTENRHEAALMLIGREVGSGMPEATFANEYVQAVNVLLREGEQLMAQGNCARAGVIFGHINHYFPQNPELAQRLDQSSVAVTNRLALCADRLMDRGLLLYRSGKLPEAMAVWRQILEFAPDHQARQALETAALQLKNLNEIDSSK